VTIESDCHMLASHVVTPARAERVEYSISKFKPDIVMLELPVVAPLAFRLGNGPTTT